MSSNGNVDEIFFFIRIETIQHYFYLSFTDLYKSISVCVLWIFFLHTILHMSFSHVEFMENKPMIGSNGTGGKTNRFENVCFSSRSISRCVFFWKPFFFLSFCTRIEFICRRCDHIVFIWLFFNIVYTCSVCTPYHIFTFFFFFSQSFLLLWFPDLYSKFILTKVYALHC